jgi:hypothetical protein
MKSINPSTALTIEGLLQLSQREIDRAKEGLEAHRNLKIELCNYLKKFLVKLRPHITPEKYLQYIVEVDNFLASDDAFSALNSNISPEISSPIGFRSYLLELEERLLNPANIVQIVKDFEYLPLTVINYRKTNSLSAMSSDSDIIRELRQINREFEGSEAEIADDWTDEEWCNFSLQGLNRAYGDNEPDYEIAETPTTKKATLKVLLQMFDGNESELRNWLAYPNNQLENISPINVLDKPARFQDVIDALGRQQHNIPSDTINSQTESNPWAEADKRGKEIVEKLLNQPMWNDDRVASYFNLPNRTPSLSNLREQNKVLGIYVSDNGRLDDGYYYPEWQFTENTVLRGFSACLRNLDEYSAIKKLAWFESPNSRLKGGTSPKLALIEANKLSEPEIFGAIEKITSAAL